MKPVRSLITTLCSLFWIGHALLNYYYYYFSKHSYWVPCNSSALNWNISWLKNSFPNGPVTNQWGRKCYVFYHKNMWNCNIMKFETMREEKTISSLMATGKKWFFPSSWSQISWNCNFINFSVKRHNFFFPVGLLFYPLGNGHSLISNW